MKLLGGMTCESRMSGMNPGGSAENDGAQRITARTNAHNNLTRMNVTAPFQCVKFSG